MNRNGAPQDRPDRLGEGSSTGRPARVSDLTSAQRTELAQRIMSRVAPSRGIRATIPRTSRDVPAPLSPGQERIWFLDRFAPNRAFYNLIIAIRLAGPLDAPALAQAVDALVARHESLRTRYDGVGSTQRIDPPPTNVLSIEDFTGSNEADLAALAQAEVDAPIDMVRGPVFRARLLRLSATAHALFLTTHHIASDGWSQSILRRDLGLLYRAFLRHQPSPLQDLEIQYADYAAWQRSRMSTPQIEQELQFWKAYLRDAPAAVDLPIDRQRPAVQSLSGSTIRFRFDEHLVARLSALGRAHNATPFMTLLSAFGVLMARYSNQWDIVVGAPTARRPYRELEPLIGFFVNPLAVRLQMQPSLRFVELLARTRAECVETLGHDVLSFEKVVEALNPPRDPSRHPIFQVAIGLQPDIDAALDIEEVKEAELSIERRDAFFDLSLDMAQEKEGLIGCFRYDTALFDRDTVDRMRASFIVLLNSIVEHPEQRIGRLPILTATERQSLVAP